MTAVAAGEPAGGPRSTTGLVAGRDYPRSWEELEAFFPDEDACHEFLERLSWPEGFACGRCGGTGAPWRGTRRRLVCRGCGYQATVTAGTLFQGTRTPLRRWFAAAWHVAAGEGGVSARELQRRLGLGSYETAWTMLHRYRRAMVRSGRPRLRGLVEVGTLAVPARHVAGGAGAALAAIAVEDEDGAPGRVRMQRVPASGAAELLTFACRSVERGAALGAAAIPAAALLARGFRAPSARLPGHLDTVRERLGGWLLGTHQGAASAEQLDWYLDEFTFRFNRRSAHYRGLLFYRLLEEAVVTPPLPYQAIVASGTTARP